MKIELNMIWFLHKLRILFLLGVFYLLYTYTMPIFAFLWIGYFILNDLSEIVNDLEEAKETRKRQFASMKPQRKGF